MAASTPLFPASLISAEVASALPDGFTIRPLEKGDFGRGFVECLRNLTWMGDCSLAQLEARYDDMDTQGKGPYFYLVIEHQARIVGTGAVVVEKKLWVLDATSRPPSSLLTSTGQHSELRPRRPCRGDLRRGAAQTKGSGAGHAPRP